MDETTTTTGRAAADEAVEKPPDPYQPVSSVSPVSERSGQAPLESDPDWVKELARNSPGVPVLNPFDPRPVADSADRTESNGGLNALTGNEIVAAIQRNIACVAHCHARIIALIDEVERRELWAQWIGVKSLAGWVMHIAAVSAHTAREYVRVMHALREMPLVKANLSAGDLSFSKVREVTRLVGRIPDEDALRLAKLGTGAQVSVVSRNYRKLSAAEENGELPQLLPRDDVLVCSAGPGRSRIVVDLPEDDAAEFVTMLSTARQVIERREDENGEDGCAASTVPSELSMSTPGPLRIRDGFAAGRQWSASARRTDLPGHVPHGGDPRVSPRTVLRCRRSRPRPDARPYLRRGASRMRRRLPPGGAR